MTFDILTIFPGIFDSFKTESLIAKATAKKIIRVQTHNIRDYTLNRHRKVDDVPFGGGFGMVLQVEPIARALRAITQKKPKEKTRIILFSTRGKQLTAASAARLSRYQRLVCICGRYEGIDERVATHIADEELSLGPYVLNGGEVAAMVLIEAVSRFLPGFLGRDESLEERHGSYPVYSRPATFTPPGSRRAWKVPPVLLSGDHARIAAWRAQFQKQQ